MRKQNILKRGAIAITALALLSIGVTAPANAAADVKIGVITTLSGPLKSYGEAFTDALEWGLNYYTKGTMKVNGAKLVLTKKDDGLNPATATAFFKEMVGNGTKIITGTVGSGVALTLAPLAEQNKVLYISGPAKNDAITSAANKYVFRAGNTSAQDVAPLTGIKPVKGKKMLVFVEDTAFGAGNIAAITALFAPKGAIVSSIKVPVSATDFTPQAKQAADADADYIFIAWANAATAFTMLNALKAQGAYKKARPITGLAGPELYNAYGTVFDGAKPLLTNSYFPGVVKTTASGELAASYARDGKKMDLFTPDGVNAARLIIRALKDNAAVDVAKAITNLEGYTFVGLKGQITVDPTKHYLIQDMYIVTLNKSGDNYLPSLVKIVFKAKA